MVDTRERWWADGYELTAADWIDVELRDDLYQIPTTRVGQGQVVAGRHGEVPGQRRRYANNDFTLHLWMGAQSNRSDVEIAYDTLVRATAIQHRLVTYVRQLADGSQRTCNGRIITTVNPEAIGQLGIRMGIEVSVPEVFWRDVDDTIFNSAAGASLPKDLALTGFERCSGSMDDLVYTVTGPINNPQVSVISDPVLNDYFSYAGIVAAGQTLVIDSGNWTVQGTGGLAPDITKLVWTGDHILEVPPAMPGSVPTLELSGSAAGSATQLTVSGRGSYLI